MEDLSFLDLDLDAAELAGSVTWSPPTVTRAAEWRRVSGWVDGWYAGWDQVLFKKKHLLLTFFGGLFGEYSITHLI